MTHYPTIDTVKKRLRLPENDFTIDDDLEIYGSEVDEWINRELRKKLGEHDEYGDPLVFPLTDTTNPAITEDLRHRADYLLEGKFRLETTNDGVIWDYAKADFKEYLDEEFGWTEGKGFRRTPSFTITPDNGTVSTTITVVVSNYGQNEELDLLFDGTEQTTTPTPMVTDTNGTATVTFDIPTTAVAGSSTVKVTGSTRIVENRGANAYGNQNKHRTFAQRRFRVT